MALTNKQTFKIGSQVFAPQTYRMGFESLTDENSGRTADGVMHINWVKQRVRKFEFVMAPMNSTQLTTLLSLVHGKTYSLTYWDALTGAERTDTFYTSKSSADCYSGTYDNYSGLWTGVTFNAIQISGEKWS